MILRRALFLLFIVAVCHIALAAGPPAPPVQLRVLRFISRHVASARTLCTSGPQQRLPVSTPQSWRQRHVGDGTVVHAVATQLGATPVLVTVAQIGREFDAPLEFVALDADGVSDACLLPAMHIEEEQEQAEEDEDLLLLVEEEEEEMEEEEEEEEDEVDEDEVATEQVLGVHPCTWGPSYWCASRDNSARCGGGFEKLCERYRQGLDMEDDVVKELERRQTKLGWQSHSAATSPLGAGDGEAYVAVPPPTTACSLSCMNGGKLQVDKCQCQCQHGYAGADCSFQPCQRTCKNGGILDSEHCVCKCNAHYVGRSCGKPQCELDCAAGTLDRDTCTCKCPPNRMGRRCDYDQCSVQCQHGRLDTELCSCVCDAGFEGTHCEKIKSGTGYVEHSKKSIRGVDFACPSSTWAGDGQCWVAAAQEADAIRTARLLCNAIDNCRGFVVVGVASGKTWAILRAAPGILVDDNRVRSFVKECNLKCKDCVVDAFRCRCPCKDGNDGIQCNGSAEPPIFYLPDLPRTPKVLLKHSENYRKYAESTLVAAPKAEMKCPNLAQSRDGTCWFSTRDENTATRQGAYICNHMKECLGYTVTGSEVRLYGEGATGEPSANSDSFIKLQAVENE